MKLTSKQIATVKEILIEKGFSRKLLERADSFSELDFFWLAQFGPNNCLSKFLKENRHASRRSKVH